MVVSLSGYIRDSADILLDATCVEHGEMHNLQ